MAEADRSIILAEPLLREADRRETNCHRRTFNLSVLVFIIGFYVSMNLSLVPPQVSEDAVELASSYMKHGRAGLRIPSPRHGLHVPPVKSNAGQPIRSALSLQVRKATQPLGAAAQPGLVEATEASSKTQSLDVDVVIAGGGLGGLAACAAMRARGINAHVFEAAPQLLRGSTGTGIMISANGWQALEAIDPAIPPLMRARGARITRQTIRVLDKAGSVKRNFSMNATTFLDTYGAEQYNIGWAGAHEVLASMVPPEVVHTSHRVTGYSLNEGKDTLDVSFDNGHHVRAALLVGADGVGSVLRRFVAGDAACETRYNGQILWNALINSTSVPHAHDDGGVEFINCGIDGQAILTFDAGEGKTSWYLTINETDAPDGVKAAMASGAFGGFGRAGVIAELEKVFATKPLALDLLRATPEGQIFERRLADRAALMEWADVGTRGGGRVVLIGDAAHPMIPSQGQGTMLTWEDAADLAALVASKGEASGLRQGVPAAVTDFVGRRATRCAKVQQYSADAYMGKPVPALPVLMGKLFLAKCRQLLFGKKTMTDEMYGGYTAIEAS